ncbi:hypothetical protein ITJ43_03280 [Microbacterium sp. VKM Ac-2870]|uniref:hypothetical protein n=1 Tax=Microbacterium sp. VKM Ac-2870 TaxID=2783825 RepID=UPI00188D081E|nr:hypothetical protein [Microbacterium sp. VKM Ac-2870]MBF4561150.1 hypothetical protein [Microbacterium sp. VKM Ac-2870]
MAVRVRRAAPHRGRGVIVVVTVVVVALILAAIVVWLLPRGGADTSPPPAVTVSPPSAVTVSVQQDRLDIARGVMTIDVHNGGDAALQVSGIVYSDPRWSSALEWSGTMEVPAGRARSLGVTLLQPRCDTDGSTVPASAPTGFARLTFGAGDAATQADYVVDDPYGFVSRSVQTGCFAARLAQTADIELVSVSSRGSGADEVATMTVRVANHGDRPVRVDSIKSTTLLQPAAGAWTWAPALTVAAGTEATIELDAVPARCDMHAVAEDKIGTRFDTTVSVLSDPVSTGTITLVSTDEQRARFYEMVASNCGFAP